MRGAVCLVVCVEPRRAHKLLSHCALFLNGEKSEPINHNRAHALVPRAMLRHIHTYVIRAAKVYGALSALCMLSVSVVVYTIIMNKTIPLASAHTKMYPQTHFLSDVPRACTPDASDRLRHISKSRTHTHRNGETRQQKMKNELVIGTRCRCGAFCTSADLGNYTYLC